MGLLFNAPSAPLIVHGIRKLVIVIACGWKAKSCGIGNLPEALFSGGIKRVFPACLPAFLRAGLTRRITCRN
jgi:hypothetical protein